MLSRCRLTSILSAACTLILLGGFTAFAEPAPPASQYPATSSTICEQSYGGRFEQSAEVRECTVASDAGIQVYVASGSGGFEWVQTSSYNSQAPVAGVELGPATVGCAKPSDRVLVNWALDCM